LKAANASLEEALKSIKEKQVEECKKMIVQFDLEKENISEIHRNIIKGLYKKINIKEKQLLNANDRNKRFSATTSKLDSVGFIKNSFYTSSIISKKLNTEKTKPVDVTEKVESVETMTEQHVRNIVKQMMEMKVQESNKIPHHKKKLNKAKSSQKSSIKDTSCSL
jgi:hypothetical protein